MANVNRCYGINTGYGYLAGAGMYGKTKALDEMVEEAAKRLKDLYDVDITIRFNTDRESGGAYIVDDKDSSSIGISACLANSQLCSMSKEELANLSINEIVDYIKSPDFIKLETCLAKEFLLEQSQFVLINSEFRRHDTLDAAVQWLQTGTNERLQKYICERKRAEEKQSE